MLVYKRTNNRHLHGTDCTLAGGDDHFAIDKTHNDNVVGTFSFNAIGMYRKLADSQDSTLWTADGS